MSDSDSSEPSTSYPRRNAGMRHSKQLEDSDSEMDLNKDEDEDNAEENIEGLLDQDEKLEGDDGCETGDSDSSSGPPGAETCAICLGRMRGEVGSPEACDHIFCFICILEWAKTNATCPQDRRPFKTVAVQEYFEGPVVRNVTIKNEDEEQIPEENPTYCEVCHECDREDRLLLCDGCDHGYHLECLDPPLDQVPVEEWFCPVCATTEENATVGERHGEAVSQRPRERQRDVSRQRRMRSQTQAPRRIPRTQATERVRARIILKRKKAKAIKRKHRRQQKRERITNGEEEDRRPPVKFMTSFSYFGSGDDDIDAEHTEDSYADQILSGHSGQGPLYRDPASRRAAAACRLHHASFTPLPSYSGKTTATIIDRVDAQETQKEGDVLSNILEDQSIALSSSKKLALTTDRKFAKQEGLESELLDSFGKGNLVMAESVASQLSQSSEEKEQDRDDSSRKDRDMEIRRRERDRDDGRGVRNWESGTRREGNWDKNSRERENDFRRTWRNGGDGRREEWNRDYSRRGDRNERDGRWNNRRENRRYGSSFPPHQPSHFKYGGYESHRPWEQHSQQSTHQSPLEDRRRSPPRLSYQRSLPSRSSWRDRDRYRRNSPNRRRYNGHSNQKKDSQESFRHQESDVYGHRGLNRQRSPSGSRTESVKSEYNRFSADYRRPVDDSRKPRAKTERGSTESHHSKEFHDRKCLISDVVQETGSSKWHRSCDDKSDSSRSRSPVSSTKSRSSSRSLGTPHRCFEKQESEECPQPDSNGKASKYHGKLLECDNDSETSNSKADTLKHEGGNGQISRKGSHVQTKSSFDLHWPEEPDEMICQENSSLNNSREKSKKENFKDESLKSISHSSMSCLQEDTNSNVEQSSRKKTDKRKIHELSDEEDGAVSFHSQSSKSEVQKGLNERKSYKEKKDGSSKKRMNTLFGDDDGDDESCMKESPDMILSVVSDYSDDEVVAPEIRKAVSTKNGGKASKNTLDGNMLFMDDQPIATSSSLLSEVKEQHSPVIKAVNGTKSVGEGSTGVQMLVFHDGNPSDIQISGAPKQARVQTDQSTKATDSQCNAHHDSIIDSHQSAETKTKRRDTVKERSKDRSESVKPALDDSKISTNFEDKGSPPASDYFKDNSKKDWFQHTLDIIKNYKKSQKKKNYSENLMKENQSTDGTDCVGKKTKKYFYSESDSDNVSKSPTTKEKNHKAVSDQSVMDIFGDTADIECSSDTDQSIRVTHAKPKSTAHTANASEEKADHTKASMHVTDGGQVEGEGKISQSKNSSKSKKVKSESIHQEKTRDESITVSSDQDTTKSTNPHSGNTREQLQTKDASKNKDERRKGGKDNTINKLPKNQQQQMKAVLEAKVVTEVKHWLDPYYRDKSIAREEYKEIVAKCVTKVVSAECGDIIESEKMRGLVEGYVKLYKHRRTKHQPFTS